MKPGFTTGLACIAIGFGLAGETVRINDTAVVSDKLDNTAMLQEKGLRKVQQGNSDPWAAYVLEMEAMESQWLEQYGGDHAGE